MEVEGLGLSDLYYFWPRVFIAHLLYIYYVFVIASFSLVLIFDKVNYLLLCS